MIITNIGFFKITFKVGDNPCYSQKYQAKDNLIIQRELRKFLCCLPELHPGIPGYICNRCMHMYACIYMSLCVWLFITYLLGCAGSQLQLMESLDVASGIQFADEGLNPGPLRWQHRGLATVPPGKSLCVSVFKPVNKYPCYQKITLSTLSHNFFSHLLAQIFK